MRKVPSESNFIQINHFLQQEGKESTLNMNSPPSQQYSNIKENPQLQQYSQSSAAKNISQSGYNYNQSQGCSQNRISSLAGLKQIVNPGPVMQNPIIRKGSQGNNFDPKGTNMNFSQGHIVNNSHSQLQQQSQLNNNQRSLSNSKLLQQKYVAQQNKNSSIQNQTNSNTNINSSDYNFASNYSSTNANGQLSSYQSVDKQSHLQSIEKIKEDLNKKLILQQKISQQIGNSNQNSNGSKSSTPQGVSNKISSSNSEHKNNSTAATNNILLSINQSTSMNRKVSKGTVGNQNNINTFINNSSNNHVYINSSKNTSNANRKAGMINSGGESSSLNATTTHFSQGQNGNNLQFNSNSSSTQINMDNNSFQIQKRKEDNSSTNIIFEKVKKRKMNNLSIGNQQSPHQMSTSQPQSHLSSTKNLQYIIQNKSPNSQNSNNNIAGSIINQNQKGLSKTMSFSGHQNNFYSTNCYIKSPNQNQQNSGITSAGNSMQNHSALNQSAKIKNKKIQQNNQLINAIVNNQKHSTATPLSIGNNNYIRNSSQNNLSLKINKENHSMEFGLSSIQNSGIGIGNLNTMNGNLNTINGRSLQLKDSKTFQQNTSQQLSSNPKNLLQQFNSQNTTPTNSNQITHPSQTVQNPNNKKFSDGVASRQSNQQQENQQNSIQQYPAQNQSLNSSFIQQSSHQNIQQQGTHQNANNSFWSQQKVNNKIILNKLENFDLQSSSNPIDHISEIASLLLISLQETPLQDAIKKFEENVSQINQENKQKQKQIQNKMNQQLKEVEVLQKDLNILQIKLGQKEKEIQKAANTIGVSQKKKLDQQTQTSTKKKEQNNKNSIIQICDQNGNVQEVDTDKENEMLKDYILEQEKKVNQFKEKEQKMIKLLLAIKNRGIDIDDIYNHDVVNDDSNDEIKKNAPPSSAFPIKKKKNKIDVEFFKKLDNEQGYADASIVNDSDESSFGYYGKPSERDISNIQQKKPKPKLKGAQSVPKIPQKLKDQFKMNLENLKKQESEDDDEEENKQFHQNILNTLQITQEQLDELQEQLQKDPKNLNPQQLHILQQIHLIQQQHEKQQQDADGGQNTQQNMYIQNQYPQSLNNQQILNFEQDSCTDQSDNEEMQSNILPSDLKKQLTTISKQTDDDIQINDGQHLDVEEEFAKYFVQK